eukprot:TRINITY_DN47596_c0_g1_i1.p1 TRINITY_DN47596_c0_g1~~TRINITY_DN47596_c0_g1_i1.p1  ORF type:complete len:414 (+),score=114.29 TRINITY_DN47596_c0_g1_i1:52-1242(+)
MEGAALTQRRAAVLLSVVVLLFILCLVPLADLYVRRQKRRHNRQSKSALDVPQGALPSPNARAPSARPRPGGQWFGSRARNATGEPCFVVLTQPSAHGNKCLEVKQTWGAEAHIAGWATDAADEALPRSFAVHASPGRSQLGGKALGAFWWLMNDPEYGISTPDSGCQWYAMVDDDTYVVLPRLRALLATRDPAKPEAMGALLTHLSAGNSTHGDIFSGGGGMVLSRRALELWRGEIASAPLCNYNFTKSGASDTTLAHCWKVLGLTFVDVSGFYPFALNGLFGARWCGNTWWIPGNAKHPTAWRKTYLSPCVADPLLITLHYMGGQMRRVHSATRRGIRSPDEAAMLSAVLGTGPPGLLHSYLNAVHRELRALSTSDNPPRNRVTELPIGATLRR